jgi:lipopolysaccharide export system permease protein
LSLSVYLAHQFAIAVLWVLSGIAGLILLFDLVELLRKSAAAGAITPIVVVGLALMKLPHTLQDTLPFVVLFATMFGLFRMSRHHELVVMRATGVSAWQVLGPMMGLTALFGILNLLVFNPVAARLYDQYTMLARQIADPRATALDVGRAGFWLRESNADGAIVVHAADVNQDGGRLRLTGILVIVSDGNDQLMRRIEAVDGELLDGNFRLVNAQGMTPGEATRQFAEYLLPTKITLAQVQDSFARPETLSFWDLPSFIAFSRAAGFSALPHRLYLQSLLASPLMLCAMVLMGAAFFLTALARAGVWLARTLGGLGAGVLLYFFARFAYALGLSAQLPISLAAWAPVIVSALLSLTYLLYREDG